MKKAKCITKKYTYLYGLGSSWNMPVDKGEYCVKHYTYVNGKITGVTHGIGMSMEEAIQLINTGNDRLAYHGLLKAI